MSDPMTYGVAINLEHRNKGTESPSIYTASLEGSYPFTIVIVWAPSVKYVKSVPGDVVKNKNKGPSSD